jgi:hypothetical protein
MRFGQFSSFKVKNEIDSDNGIIHGVSVITVGEALGHDVWIDEKTLRQVKNTASTYAGGLKVKMNHYSGVESIAGVLRNFKVDGKQLRADLHLLKSTDEYDKIIEMAETMPESFGLSIVFDNEPETIEKVQYARCKEIYSADLVDNPAANPSGLFSVKSNKNVMTKQVLEALGLTETATEAEALAAIEKLGKAKYCGCGKAGCKSCAAYESENPKHKGAKDNDKDDMGSEKIAAALEALKTNFEAVTTTITELKSKSANAEALAKKSEIDSLIVEASKEGKEVPFENDDLYTVKDGVITIKTEPTMLKKVISKLSPKVKLARHIPVTIPKNDKGEEIKGEALKEFNRNLRAEGAVELTRIMAQQMNPRNS